MRTRSPSSWKRLTLFISYVWITTLMGLAIHPYQSVRRMVFEKDKRILLPVVLSPFGAILVFLLVGRVGSYFLNISGAYREIISGILGWSLIGLLLWQVLMIMLVVRFARGLWR